MTESDSAKPTTHVAPAPEPAGATRSTVHRALVIGVGNPYRSDDGAGLAVTARVREHAPPGVQTVDMEGEVVSLLDAWEGASVVYLVDAVWSGGEPGSVYRFDACGGLAPAAFRHRGTHTFSVADTIELARALDRLPPRLVVYGIEAASFAAGTGLSPEVAAAVRDVTSRLLDELASESRSG
ncbi:MAG TPA: hydrogenase maturation protease [Streptosporangiaceae bacterium]|nr:hydrogenase maturation protease [Streptosporangiaceae bacterium]